MNRDECEKALKRLIKSRAPYAVPDRFVCMLAQTILDEIEAAGSYQKLYDEYAPVINGPNGYLMINNFITAYNHCRNCFKVYLTNQFRQHSSLVAASTPEEYAEQVVLFCEASGVDISNVDCATAAVRWLMFDRSLTLH